jgi:hypothetical protein
MQKPSVLITPIGEKILTYFFQKHLHNSNKQITFAAVFVK